MSLYPIAIFQNLQKNLSEGDIHFKQVSSHHIWGMLATKSAQSPIFAPENGGNITNDGVFAQINIRK